MLAAFGGSGTYTARGSTYDFALGNSGSVAWQPVLALGERRRDVVHAGRRSACTRLASGVRVRTRHVVRVIVTASFADGTVLRSVSRRV